MCNWKSWILPGIVAVSALTGAAALLKSGPVEADLGGRAAQALSAGHPWASVQLDGRDLTLAGVAPSEEAAAAALVAAAGVDGVRVAKSASTLLPVADPYVLSMEHAGDRVSVSGSVPGEDARKALLSAIGAALPGIGVDDNTVLARGAPEGFDALAAFAATQLGSLASGTASLSGTQFSIMGVAKSASGLDALKAALTGAIPGGGTLAKAEISPAAVSPYAFSASRDGKAVSLTGFIPEEAMRAVLVEAAKAAVPGAAIDDQLQLGSGAPAGFSALSRFAVDGLAFLKSGSVTLSDAAFAIKGLAASPEGMDSLKKAMAAAISAGGTAGAIDVDPGKPAKAAEPAKPKEEPKKVEAPKPVEPAPAPKPAIVLPALPSASGAIAGKAPAVPQAAKPAEPEKPAEAAKPAEPAKPAAAIDCQKQLDAILKGETIQFEKGDAMISKVSLPLLDKLAAAAAACPQVRIEIGGHTDSDGSEADNQKLSEDRAMAVAGYIAKAGVDAGRLSAKGFGEAKPVAENTTPEGKAQNRRIEFRVLN